MNPLSPLTYYRRHKWTALLLLGLIILTTLGLYLMVAILDSTTLMFAEIGYLKRVSQIYPNGAPSFERGIISRVQAHPDVERVIPEKGLAILQPALVNPFDVSLLGIRQEDLPYLTDRFGLRIQKGRMLQPRTNEIMLSEEVARALGLTLGDQIDRSIDPDAYYLIQTPMVLVGILEADPSALPKAGPNVRVGFASYEYLDSHELYKMQITTMLVVAKEGRRQAVAEFLETEIASPRTVVDTYERQYQLNSRDRQGLLVAFGFINIAVAIGAAVVVGIVNQIAIAQRLPELGMLNALGYDKNRLIHHLALETAAVSGLSWIVGLVLAFIVLVWLKTGPYYDTGMELDLLNLTPLWFVVPIPLTVIALSTIGIARVFAKFDAVAIVERGKLSMETQTRLRVSKLLPGSGAISAFTFYRRHRRRGVILLMSMVVAILVISMPVFAATATADAMKPDLEYLHYVSEVWPEGALAVDAGVMAQIRNYPAVERIIPTMALALQVAIPLGDRVTTDVYGVLENDLPYLLDLFGMGVKEGRLPHTRSNEIVIAEAVALNQGLRVGDTIGLPYHILHQAEQMILLDKPVEMVVVGILENQTERSGAGQAVYNEMWLSFASYEFMASHESLSSRPIHLFVVPREGRKTELDTWLEQEIASTQTNVATYAAKYGEIQEMMRNLTLLFAATEIGIVVVAAIAVAIINYISFAQRREEFGVLNALGRSLPWLVRRTAKETASIAAVAWLISAVIYGVVLLCIQAAVYAPKGIGLNLLNPIPWLFMTPVPLVVILASAGTIAQALRRLDPVAVIERR
jgi:ABC-type antimicrobial peptide transport system permease subunit